MLAIAMLVAVAATAALPVVATAQNGSSAFEQTWQLLEYANTDGKLEQVPPGVGVELKAWDGEVFGDVACGEYEADYDLTAPNLKIHEPAIDRVDCDPAARSVDDAFFRALDQTASIGITGSILTLRDVTDFPLMRLTSADIPEDPTIARWEMARIGSADGASGPVIPGTKPWIEFLRGGRFVGRTGGCGSFYGSYQLLDLTVELTDVNARLRDCTEQLRDQAEAILANLGEIKRFQVRPAGLTLEDGEGNVRLAMVPDLDLGLRTWTPVQILDADGTATVEAERLDTSAIRFAGGRTAKGDADGRTFCRQFSGDSLVSGLALSVDVTPVKGRCPKGTGQLLKPQDVETAFLEALQMTSSHALRGEELELFDRNGVRVMRLVPQADLVGPTWVLEQWNRGKGKKADWRTAVGQTEVTAEFQGLGVIVGDTGVVDPKNGRTSSYTALFRTPKATVIEISDIEIRDQACRGNRANKPECIQQRTLGQYLSLADTVIVEADSMRLLAGARPLLRFTRQSARPSE